MAKRVKTGKGSGSGKSNTVYFINAAGGGFSDTLEVEVGCTVAELFEDMMKGAKPESYLIMVNRMPVAADEVIQDGDRVSITPVQVKGS